MQTPSSSVPIWESGRLCVQPPSSAIDAGTQRWIATALLVLSATVLAIFVAVVEQDVQRGEIQREQQRSRAVAEAGCEASQPAQSRGSCLAMFSGAAVQAAQATPPNDLYPQEEDAARAVQVSTATVPAFGGLQQP